MTGFRVAAAVVLMGVGVGLGAAPVQAADSVNGRWAADSSACSGFGQSALEVTNDAVRWTTGTCRIARMYKTGDTVHIQALCWGEGGERSIPVSLRPHAGRLVVTWDRGARGELQRCP
jgi:hypothetical protein